MVKKNILPDGFMCGNLQVGIKTLATVYDADNLLLAYWTSSDSLSGI